MHNYLTKRILLGLPIYDTNMHSLITYLDKIVIKNDKKVIFGISAAAYARLKFRKDLYGIYKRFDILVAEGAGLPLLGKLFGVTITEKIGMVNLTYNLLQLANVKRYKVLLFGASQEVNDFVVNRIHASYPKIRLCKSINGYFKEPDIDIIIDKINNENPNILFIGISYPIKERFAIKYKEKLNTNLIVPCGGVFEVIAGKVKRPKLDFKKFPIAWIYRFVQEPRRLFKDIVITILYTIFYVVPILYIKHITGIEKNPDIGKFFKLSGKEWNPVNGSVKP